MVQVLGEPTRKGAFLDFLLVNREEPKWRLVAILATVTTKQSSLKSLVRGKKVPAKLQPWT